MVTPGRPATDPLWYRVYHVLWAVGQVGANLLSDAIEEAFITTRRQVGRVIRRRPRI